MQAPGRFRLGNCLAINDLLSYHEIWGRVMLLFFFSLRAVRYNSRVLIK